MATYRIVGGPSRLDLMLHCFDRESHEDLVFKIRYGSRLEELLVEVKELHPPNFLMGNPDQWKLVLNFTSSDPGFSRHQASCVFDSHTRKGELTADNKSLADHYERNEAEYGRRDPHNA